MPMLWAREKYEKVNNDLTVWQSLFENEKLQAMDHVVWRKPRSMTLKGLGS